MMKTGQNLFDDSELFNLDKPTHAVLLAMLTKVIETACQYTEASGRNAVTLHDIVYAFRFQSHVFFYSSTLSEDVDSCMQLLQDEDDDATSGSEGECDDDKDSVEDSVSDDAFQRCTSDPFCVRVNMCYDGWDTWHPSDPIQQAIKNAVDSIDLSNPINN